MSSTRVVTRVTLNSLIQEIRGNVLVVVQDLQKEAIKVQKATRLQTTPNQELIIKRKVQEIRRNRQIQR